MTSNRFGIRVFSPDGKEWVWFEEQTTENYYESGVNVKTFSSLDDARTYAAEHEVLSLNLERIDYFKIPSSFIEEDFLMSIIEYDVKEDEYLIPLPKSVTDYLDVVPGDSIVWDVNEDGSIYLHKKK